jgi:hypothetical protein
MQNDKLVNTHVVYNKRSMLWPVSINRNLFLQAERSGGRGATQRWDGQLPVHVRELATSQLNGYFQLECPDLSEAISGLYRIASLLQLFSGFVRPSSKYTEQISLILF